MHMTEIRTMKKNSVQQTWHTVLTLLCMCVCARAHARVCVCVSTLCQPPGDTKSLSVSFRSYMSIGTQVPMEDHN